MNVRSPDVIPASRTWWILAWTAFLIFLSLSIGYSVTRQPWWDEGMFADPAITFRNLGHFGSSVLDPQGYRNWPGVHQYTYWQFPLYLIGLGVWLHVVPVTIFWIRLFSVAWAAVYIYCWFILTRYVARDERLALLVASIVALDYSVIAAASDGRMDMMCVALGQMGVTYFICTRKVNWTRAVFVAAAFGAAAVFCHPLGLICNSWIAIVVLLDWREIQWKRIWVAAIPYAIGLCLYALYVAQAPEVFLAQIRAAFGYRMTSDHGVLMSILRDLYARYWHFYFGALTGVSRLKVASLIPAVLGPVLLLLDRGLRRDPLARTFLVLAVVGYVGVAAMDNQQLPVYFVYSMPAMTACGALWVYSRGMRHASLRLLSCIILAGSILATIGGFGVKIAEDKYTHLYLAAVKVINANLPSKGLVMGGSELGFALGFNGNLIDDRFVGYSSGKKPDVFVENEYYGGGGPGWDFSRQLLRTQYHVIFENGAYRVYVLNAPDASVAH